MNDQKEFPVKIMLDIHRLVQKLKDIGMSVDSTVDTTVEKEANKIKYTDSLTITGDFVNVRLDERDVTQIKADAEAYKAQIEAETQERVEKIEQIITAADTK